MNFIRTRITNFRVLADAEFSFHPQFTLIVGVNGVGKSTLLDALRICASRLLPEITPSKAKSQSFDAEDIAKDLPFVDVNVFFELSGREFTYTRRQWKRNYADDRQSNLDQLRRAILDTERPRIRLRELLRDLRSSQDVSDRDHVTPSSAQLQECASRAKQMTNCIFFSTSRSIVSEATFSKSKTVGDKAAAYAEGLHSRPLYLIQIAEWIRAQMELAPERLESARHLRVLESAVRRFLPNYDSLRPGKDGEPRLAINKKGATIDVRQLSDGERGILSLVLDISRKLSQANPHLKDPLGQGEAIILIDELDLHLHPKWQRTIVERLTSVFPRCQFIATTHSPQIVASVEPEQVQLMKDGEVITPDRTFGMDTNWILRHLMEADDRPADAVKRVHTIEELIRRHSFKKARAAIATAKKRGYDFPEWSMFDARMARMELMAK